MALIDDFRKQTRETILDHMDRLGVNHAVYSTHLKGYEPDLLDKNIFIYIHANSMVVVCFDLCGSRDEIAGLSILFSHLLVLSNIDINIIFFPFSSCI